MTLSDDPNRPPTGAEARALTEATNRLVDRFVPRSDFDRHRRNVRLALVGVLVAGVLLIVVVIVLGVTVIKLGDVTDSNREVIDSVNECITPAPPEDLPEDPHECYERGERRTAEALEAIAESFNATGDRIVDRLEELHPVTP